MKKTTFLPVAFILVIFFSITSCKKDPDGPADIRIRNRYTTTFHKVWVNTSGGEYTFGDVLPGQETEYHRFDIAYRQAHITLEINGVQYELIPVDYTYEITLGQGKFTYELTVADTVTHTLAIHVIADAPL